MDRDITITTRLADTVTTPMLLKTLQSHKVDPQRRITHSAGSTKATTTC
jgi:alcohol dehydrogenase